MLTFWKDRLVEIRNSRGVCYRHVLPSARIRKIMKSDKQVKMISADTPILFAKACEIFILELTLRAWMNAEDNNRQVLQRCDVVEAIMGEDLLSFLAKIVSFDRNQETAAGDTHQCPAYPMNLHNLNSALLMRSQEVPQHPVFPPSFSSAEINYQQGFNALHTRSYEVPQHHVFSPSFSSAETNYRQGFNQLVTDCPGDTREYSAYPMSLHNLNSALLVRSQEGPQHLVFPPQISSAETNYLPDLNR